MFNGYLLVGILSQGANNPFCCCYLFFFISLSVSQSSQQRFVQQKQPHLQLPHADQPFRRRRSSTGVRPAGRDPTEVRDHAVFRRVWTQVHQRRGGRYSLWRSFGCKLHSSLAHFSVFFPCQCFHPLSLSLPVSCVLSSFHHHFFWLVLPTTVRD